MNSFFFGNSHKYVVGIDENGYGPFIGPLIVTGIGFDMPYDSIYSADVDFLRAREFIKDSKRIFTRTESSYKKGEGIALSLLRLSGFTGNSFFELIKYLFDRDSEITADFALPAFGGQSNNNRLVEMFKNRDIYVKTIKSSLFDAVRFNKQALKLPTKAFIDFLGFADVIRGLKADIFLCGKIGGTSHYQRFFKYFGIEATVLGEKREVSEYNVQNSHVIFLLNGDERFVPLMAASIVGKYIRELYMKSISMYFGYAGVIPYASGYYHDKKSYELLNSIKESNMENLFVRVK